MFITVKREMGMLITVICYLSYLIERRRLNCTKAPLKEVMLVSSFLSNVA